MVTCAMRCCVNSRDIYLHEGYNRRLKCKKEVQERIFIFSPAF